MSAPFSDKRRVGELRPSQLLFTFGVGAIVELPNLSVMVMGLDDWPIEQGSQEISEPRLLKAVQQELGAQVVKLLTPPITTESSSFQSNPFDETANVGVPVAPFPRWLLCPYCRLLAPIQSGLFEMKLDPYRRDRSRYVHRICKKPGKPPAVVPARFLVACNHGHLDDFPWVEFTHRDKKSDCRYELRLYELGATGEVSDIQVECVKCGKHRRMSDAFGDEGRVELSGCRSRYPHLRKFDEEACKERQRAILLGASNSWFPLMLSALHFPATSDKLDQLIEMNWPDLEECESAREVKLKRKLLKNLSLYTDEQVYEAIVKKKEGGGKAEDYEDLREPEWEVFSNPGSKPPTRDFKIRQIDSPTQYKRVLDKVVLAERLREVRSLIAFTRIESPGDYSELDDFPREQRVTLCRAAPKWVPTSEVRGEGVFIQFSEEAIQTWLKKTKARNSEFNEAHRRWRRARGLEPDEGYPGMRYVLLHSLSHALIRQFSLECGYSTASIRERIYSRPPAGDAAPMAGVLLYTAAPDSEGTLGGLVALGKPSVLGRHLDQALETITLCASDPLCAEHHPFRDSLTLHGAACHACLFLPETSCERGNKYLDRAVLVSTVEADDLAFFGEFAESLPEKTITAHTGDEPAPAKGKPSEIDQLVALCDERCRVFVRGWADAGLPLPDVGFEVQDNTGRVAAQAELAWPAKQIAALVPEGAEARPVLEKQGWRVFDATMLKPHDADLRELFKE